MSAMPLRRRVTLALTLLGFLLSTLFAAATLKVTEDYEYVIATELLRGQAEDYGLRLANGLPAQLPRTQRLSGYTRADVPPRYANFPLGVHEDATEERVHVGVFDTSAGRLYFSIDLGDIEALERLLGWALAAVVVLGTFLSGFLGWLFAGAALVPVARLARAVDALQVAPQATHLGAQVSDDELGRLARAIDGYQRRLVDADTHEQAFFADASHELRTPIAVVQGATEVMLDDADAEREPRRIERLRRLERGVREMTDLVEMLLAVSRRPLSAPEWQDAAGVLREVVASLPSDPAQPDVDIAASGRWQAPVREVRLLLRHAIRTLGWPASGDPLSLRLERHRLDLSVPLPAGRPATDRSDTGGVGPLAQRLASQLGWRLERPAPGHLRIELPRTSFDEAGPIGDGPGPRGQDRHPGVT